jgi:hypothetical protein
MIFKQYEDGSCDIEFSKEELNIIFKKEKLHLSAENLRHFGNNLVKIVSDWNTKFNENLQNKNTFEYTKINGE